MEEVKKLKENPANVGIKIVEIIDFEETEAEKLEIVKRHHGSKTEQRIKYDYCPELFNLLNYYCIDRTSFGKLFDAFVDVLRENS